MDIPQAGRGQEGSGIGWPPTGPLRARILRRRLFEITGSGDHNRTPPAGLTPIKLNCVVRRDVNDHTLVDLARRFRGTGHVVRFIEFMDVGTLNRWEMAQVVSAVEIRDRIDAEFPLVPLEPNYLGEVAQRYRYADGGGEIGIIASVTHPFCGDCTRARLSADGRLVTCLFASSGTDLKTPLRAGASDGELAQIVAGVWTGRADRYSEERAEPTRGRAKIQMYQIGG